MLPLIASIVWQIIGAVMALRYLTQTLRVAASTSTFSLMYFVTPDSFQRAPTYQALVRNFANLRPPMAHTIIKDNRQIEHNFVTLVRARARCTLPMPLEFHPVE